MRNISDTNNYPPRNGERFRDGKNVVEFRSQDAADDFSPCERCLYDDDIDGCLCIGACMCSRQDENHPPFFGYYVRSAIKKD